MNNNVSDFPSYVTKVKPRRPFQPSEIATICNE